jgi:hypothetical protein
VEHWVKLYLRSDVPNVDWSAKVPDCARNGLTYPLSIADEEVAEIDLIVGNIRWSP